MRNKELEKIASRYYNPKLPYHNFGHVVTVIRESERMLEKCRAQGIQVNEDIVYYALLFHDAGYYEDHTALGFDSKEAYSASISERVLKDNGVDQGKIEKIKTAIMSTHMDAKCTCIEDKIVRAADLSELAADYQVFKKNTLNLKSELETFSNRKVSWDEWKQSAVNTVELFLREEMDVTGDYFDENGVSLFHKNARANLKKLLADDSEEL
jgi:predicted metal-dependent HD superfamily phosphohydrolase